MTRSALGRMAAQSARVNPVSDEIGLLRSQLEEVRARLADTTETLRAISSGEVDALIVGAEVGTEQVFTLTSADRPYRNFVENMSDGAATVSAEGLVLYANQALATLMASTCERIVGQPVLELVIRPSRRVLAQMLGAGGRGGSFEADLLAATGDPVPAIIGSSRLLIDGEPVICLTVTDLTRERRAEAAAAHSAQHDALTALPNRTLLTDRINHALDRRTTASSVVALLFCDIDGFKNINDAHGHQIGDEVLKELAARLRLSVRPADTVARIGGDEFVVLCEGLPHLDDAAIVAGRVREAVAEPIVTHAGDIEVTVSIGVAAALAGQDATSDTLLRDSDEAMYKAKRQGSNVIELFDEQLRASAMSRLTLLSDMRHAAADGELRLHYQPVVDLADERIVGMEALIRWHHPTRGLVPPDEFIPFAERSGQIIGIGAWVLREACQQAALWSRDPGGASRDVAINISGRQLAQSAGLVATLRSAIADSGVRPQQLVLEVTESAIMDDAVTALRVINECKELGVKVAIDDFGTGYSSLVYLKRFPVDVLKVDRSFVAGLGANQDDAAIVHSVIKLAQAFNIETVAEGVETREQLHVLTALGCSMGQGYLWSPPRPASELEEMLSPATAVLPSQRSRWNRARS